MKRIVIALLLVLTGSTATHAQEKSMHAANCQEHILCRIANSIHTAPVVEKTPTSKKKSLTPKTTETSVISNPEAPTIINAGGDHAVVINGTKGGVVNVYIYGNIDPTYDTSEQRLSRCKRIEDAEKVERTMQGPETERSEAYEKLVLSCAREAVSKTRFKYQDFKTEPSKKKRKKRIKKTMSYVPPSVKEAEYLLVADIGNSLSKDVVNVFNTDAGSIQIAWVKQTADAYPHWKVDVSKRLAADDLKKPLRIFYKKEKRFFWEKA